MKKALAVVAQSILFLAVFAVFSILPPFGMHWFVAHPGPTVVHYFVADGFVLATALFLLILIVEAAAKRIRTAGALTTIGYAVAMVLGFAVKLGSWTHDSLG